MGRNRNAAPNEKFEDITWEDESVCKFFLVDMCPHELFNNTKVDLGPCQKIHKEDLRKSYQETKDGIRKIESEDEYIRFCQKILSDLSQKIRRSKERLVLSHTEKKTTSGVSPSEQEEIEEKIGILTEKINLLVDKAEMAGCKGDVEEAQGVLKLCDQLKAERAQLKSQLGVGSDYMWGKPMEVCEICGAFLVVGDAKSRTEDHLNGKHHNGFIKLKASLEKILERRRKRREEREKRLSGEAPDERRWRRGGSNSTDDYDDADRHRKSRDRKSHERRRSRSRSRHRRSRSRSRDRRPRHSKSSERSRKSHSRRDDSRDRK